MAKRQKPLYGGGLFHYNRTVPTIIPPILWQDDRILYDVFKDEGDSLHLEQVLDERDTIQVTTEMQSMRREQLVDAYRKDELYKLALNSCKTARGGRMEHYRISDRLMFATTRKGLQALYIPKGHAANGQTLRELVISEVHDKGHHSAERNLRYATKYLYWPEMRKNWRDYVSQCEHSQRNKEWNTLPEGNAQMMPIHQEIFTSYAIDFTGPFNKSKGPTKTYDMVLVVVGRAVGFTWFIPTTSDANSETTLSYLRHHVFTSHGTPTSIVSDADPKFTSRFWQQSMKSMGIEHSKAEPGHHETNGQVECKIRELKTALRNISNKRQNDWVNSLQDMAAYTNAGHSDTINMSPYEAVYGRDYPLLATYRMEGKAVPASEDYLNRHQKLRNDAYQALKLARVRSTRVAARRRTTHKPISIGEFLMVDGDRFATESGRSKKLEPQ